MQRGGSATRVAVVAIVATLALGGCGGDDDDGGGDGGTSASAEPIRLEPVDAPLPDPFVDGNLDVGGDLGAAAGAVTADVRGMTDAVSSALSGHAAPGDAAGLYGGSLDAEVCDTAQLVSFLTDPANAAQAEAWAGVQGIGVDEIPDYVAGLASVRLRFDTRVTNHGFEGGEARPFPSILQAGTAVLVDGRGAPRARCFCGNPLAEPEPLAGEAGDDALDLDTLAENPEDAWDGLDPENVVTVEPGAPSDSLVVADLETGEQVEKPVGSGGGRSTPPAGPTTPTTAPTTAPSTTAGTAPPGGGGCTNRTEVRPDGAIVEYCD